MPILRYFQYCYIVFLMLNTIFISITYHQLFVYPHYLDLKVVAQDLLFYYILSKNTVIIRRSLRLLLFAFTSSNSQLITHTCLLLMPSRSPAHKIRSLVLFKMHSLPQ